MKRRSEKRQKILDDKLIDALYDEIERLNLGIESLQYSTSDKSRSIRDFRVALNAIYAERGEDDFIAKICDPLLDRI